MKSDHASEEIKIDFSEINPNIINKLQLLEKSKLNTTLIEISKSKLFDTHPEYFDTICTQTNSMSQKILFDAFNGGFSSNKLCIETLIYYSNKPIIQQRIMYYSRIPDIFYNEYYLISMLGIEDENVERKMRKCFEKGLINSTHDFIHCKKRFELITDVNERLKKLILG